MLPGLGRLSLTRTGGSLAQGQSPEDVACVICFHSLAAPPPDGENVWPFDDDPVIWIVACNNQHAFHKGCLRAYARDSENPDRCPECRVPMLPQVLTHVSRPSTGGHAAREAREAEERAEGQERDAEDARRREREMLERMQREFQEMGDEDRRMHADAYGDPDSDLEEEDEEDEEEDEDFDAVEDLAHLHHLADLVNEASPYDHRRRIVDVQNQATKIIDQARDNGQYHSEVLDAIYRTADTQAWLLYVIASPESDYPYAVRGQVLRLLAFFADTYTVRDIIREYDEPWTVSGRLDPSTAGRFTAAVKEYMNHLETLPTIADDPSFEHDYERDLKPKRLADARRVLHYMKWQDVVQDAWLDPPQRLIVDPESESDASVGGLVEVANQLIHDLDQMIVEGGLVAVGGPAQHETVMAKLWTFWTTLKDWQRNNPWWRRRCPFGRQIVKLWAVANYAQRKASNEHRNVDFLSTGDSSEEEELQEMVERYNVMTERLVRTLWLSVSMWVRANPDADPATDDEMMTFFYQYVAHFYTGNATLGGGWALFDCDDTNEIEDANADMREQLMGDRRVGPWDGPWDASAAPTTSRGEGTPDPRRQRLR